MAASALLPVPVSAAVRASVRPHVRGGRITVISGPMSSEKTTNLLSFVRRFLLARKKCLIIRYSKDCRYSDSVEICSRDGMKVSADFSCDKLAEVPTAAVEKADCVVIDEGQFFPDLVAFSEDAAERGKRVVVAGLSTDWKREPYPVIAALSARAEENVHLKAVCTVCGEDAYFSRRIVASTEEQLIGGCEKYQARCRGCFDELPTEASLRPLRVAAVA